MNAKITYEIASNKISYLIHSTYKTQVIMYKQKYKPLFIRILFGDHAIFVRNIR